MKKTIPDFCTKSSKAVEYLIKALQYSYRKGKKAACQTQHWHAQFTSIVWGELSTDEQKKLFKRYPSMKFFADHDPWEWDGSKKKIMKEECES